MVYGIVQLILQAYMFVTDSLSTYSSVNLVFI